MLVIGLTGGIASGKTAASDYFARLGVPVVDADVIARQVVEPGQPGLQAVVAAFGAEVLDKSDRLDRTALRKQVFSDPEARRKLEAILHPRIRQRLRQELATANGPYAVVVVPLLVESAMQDMVSRVLVVDVPELVQRQRVQQRDGGTPEQADAVIAAQTGRGERLAAADDVIRNTGTLEQLHRQIETLHQRYLGLAKQAEKGTTATG
ncbi:MAG: dephospho-CoA kinase [Aquisalimonadaceae bacterium]